MFIKRIIPLVSATILWTSSLSASSSIVESHHPVPPLDVEALTSKLLQGPIHEPEVYTRAVTILDSMEAAPSCHRMATLTLINSCQSLERSPTAEVALAEVREEYATRLAMCELMGAKVIVPSQCSQFLPQDGGCKRKRTFAFLDKFQSDETTDSTEKKCYRDASTAQVKQCLVALHARPQWWTSYSNALQNVVVVCLASRSAIEKDEILELFRTGTGISSDLTSALADSLSNAKTFSVALDAFQAHAKASLEEHLTHSKTSFGQLILSIQNAVQSLLGSMNEGADDASRKMSELQRQIIANQARATETDNTLQEIHDSSIRRNQDLNSAQMATWKHVSAQAGEVEHSLHKVVQWELPALEIFLQSYLQHLKNFTEVLSEGNSALESHISRNSEKLQQQADIIAQVQSFGGSEDMTKWAIFFILMVLLQSLSPWMASILAVVVAAGLIFYKLKKLMISLHLLSSPSPIGISNSYLPHPVYLALIGLALLVVISTFIFTIYTHVKSCIISKDKDGILMLRIEEPDYSVVDPTKQSSFIRHLR